MSETESAAIVVSGANVVSVSTVVSGAAVDEKNNIKSYFLIKVL